MVGGFKKKKKKMAGVWLVFFTTKPFVFIFSRINMTCPVLVSLTKNTAQYT